MSYKHSIEMFIRTRYLLAVFFALFWISPLRAEQAATVSNVSYQETKANFYTVSGGLANPSDLPREVVVRAQLTFYDKASPKGDIPAAVVRKDITVVLKPGENRELSVSLINEGRMPRGSYRVEPMLRIRRDREWNY